MRHVFVGCAGFLSRGWSAPGDPSSIRSSVVAIDSLRGIIAPRHIWQPRGQNAAEVSTTTPRARVCPLPTARTPACPFSPRSFGRDTSARPAPVGSHRLVLRGGGSSGAPPMQGLGEQTLSSPRSGGVYLPGSAAPNSRSSGAHKGRIRGSTCCRIGSGSGSQAWPESLLVVHIADCL